MQSLFELASAYAKAGVSIIPISPNEPSGPNGNKDLPFDCSEHITRRIASADELHEWFAHDGQFGLAAVLGPISGNLECLDLTYAAVGKLFRQLVVLQGGEDLLEKLPAAQSPLGGRTRLYYRCPKATRGYLRMAQFELPSEPETVKLQLLAFVHGEGSWTVLPGLPTTYGDFDEVYEWVGHDLSEVPTITEDERQLLLESASCLNAWVDPNSILAPIAPDRFDSQVPWEEILVPLHWKKIADFGEVSLWQTPERTKPGYCAVSGIGFNRDLLNIIGTGRAYTKFGAFVCFYFGGDVEKAQSARLRSNPTPCSKTTEGRRRQRAITTRAVPLVSCIMPTTGDRRRFVPQAIKCFQRQTYPNLELVIVCDGEDDLSDLIPCDDERIRYSYMGRERRTIGPKRNLACEQAKGNLIALFDDDDWSHPNRLQIQVGKLLAAGVEFCGLPLILFYVIASGDVWLWQTPALLHPSLWNALPAGASFLFRREYWSRSPFPDIRLGSDMAFIGGEGRQDHAVMVGDYRLYVATIHTCNTDDYSKYSPSSYWTPWRGDLREIMGDDLDFYESLRITCE
jgi:hypothetical protein